MIPIACKLQIFPLNLLCMLYRLFLPQKNWGETGKNIAQSCHMWWTIGNGYNSLVLNLKVKYYMWPLSLIAVVVLWCHTITWWSRLLVIDMWQLIKWRCPTSCTLAVTLLEPPDQTKGRYFEKAIVHKKLVLYTAHLVAMVLERGSHRDWWVFARETRSNLWYCPIVTLHLHMSICSHWINY